MRQIKASEAKPDMDRLHLEHSREDYRRVLAFYSAAGLIYTPECAAAKRLWVAELEAELEELLGLGDDK